LQFTQVRYKHGEEKIRIISARKASPRALPHHSVTRSAGSYRGSPGNPIPRSTIRMRLNGNPGRPTFRWAVFTGQSTEPSRRCRGPSLVSRARQEVPDIHERGPSNAKCKRHSRLRSTASSTKRLPKSFPSAAQKEETTMSHREFPNGWSEDKVRRVLAHYQEQSDEDALLEDEAGIEPSETVMSVPHDLVPNLD
jgi:hypothetical protein